MRRINKNTFDADCAVSKNLVQLSRKELCDLVAEICRQVKAESGTQGYHGGLYPENISRSPDGAIGIGPGSSEHQLGLAIDIWDRQYNRTPLYENMDQEFFEWLDAHCADYGFIKRYPTRKLLLTGWDEPWHYRYVGIDAAKFIMEKGICYEEFYKHYMPDFKY